MPLVDHPSGNYRFLPGIAPYSCGAVAVAGYEIAHVTLNQPLPWRAGLEAIGKFLIGKNRPLSALCAVELRSPQPFTFAGFAEFNAEYAQVLREWSLFVDGVNPVARTNIAPELAPPAEPVVFAFSFTQPAIGHSLPTFVVAGAGELPEGVLKRDGIIALGDVSAAGLKTKADYVVGLMTSRLLGLGIYPAATTEIDVYTVHPIHDLIVAPILAGLPGGRWHGVNWLYSRPPILDIEFEMDVRGVQTELRI